jgi:outer membrane biogenesis lipoprotein LolB
MKRIIPFLIIAAFLLTACTTSIEDLKSDEYVDEKVTIAGEVQGVIAIGEFTGYSLADSTGEIGVLADKLPEEGDRVRVRGTVKRLPLLNFYYVDSTND